MKPGILAAATATVLTTSLPATADWTRVVESPSGRTVYVDPAGVVKAGDTRRLTELWDYRAPDHFGDLSSQLEVEYDCAAAKRRIVSWTGFRAAMATGGASGRHPEVDSGWQPIAPRTLAAAVAGVVCLD